MLNKNNVPADAYVNNLNTSDAEENLPAIISDDEDEIVPNVPKVPKVTKVKKTVRILPDAQSDGFLEAVEPTVNEK